MFPEDVDLSESKYDTNGYTLVWDNVGKKVRARHQDKGKKNKMNLWALSYCARNRVPTTHLSNSECKLAVDIPLVGVILIIDKHEQ